MLKAVTSAMATMAISKTYVHPVTKPANGPRYRLAYWPKEPETGCRTAISPRARITMNTAAPPMM